MTSLNRREDRTTRDVLLSLSRFPLRRFSSVLGELFTGRELGHSLPQASGVLLLTCQFLGQSLGQCLGHQAPSSPKGPSG
jgi:hypothetical protein